MNFIYLDPSLFRPFTRNLNYWNEFTKFFNCNVPNLLADFKVLFTWSQLLEECNLGRVMNGITNTKIWKAEIDGKKLFDRLHPNEAWDKYFTTAQNAAMNLPELQKDHLLQSINKAISHTCPEAKFFINEAFRPYTKAINANDYIVSLSAELAWSFITSNSLIRSERQWEERKGFYDTLIMLWHKLFLEGHDCNFFRLCEKQYQSYLANSSDLNMEEVSAQHPNIANRIDLLKKLFKFSPLKSGSDLCDGEIVHLSLLGKKMDNEVQRTRVIGITMDEQAKIQQRMETLYRSLLDLKRDVEGWEAEVCLGEIISVSVSKEGKVNSAHRISPSAPIS